MDENIVIKKLDEIDTKLNGMVTKVEFNDKIASLVTKDEFNDKIASLVTKDEFAKFRNEVLDGADKQIKILVRLDEERYFTVERIRTIEKEVEKIKLHLQLA